MAIAINKPNQIKLAESDQKLSTFLHLDET